MLIEGQIISGELDQTKNEFALQKVKHFFTESILKEPQLNSIYDYLKKHEDENDWQVITLYDQMPVRLTPFEIKQFIQDIEHVQSKYH
jgi:two-component sensor histidine kinase